MKKRVGTSIVAFIIVAMIFFVLFEAGPAKAVILGLSILDKEVERGEFISFTASVEIESGELLDIDHLVLNLNGPMNEECIFYPNGSIISGCRGMSIVLTSSPNYRFGYGFEPGVLEYQITLDTIDYFGGTYETMLTMVVGSVEYVQKGADITIRVSIDELRGCSIRAEDGNLLYEGVDLGSRNKANFYIPAYRAATNGEGYLTGQRGRDRISFEFDISEIIENTDHNATILVSGKCKLGRQDAKNKNALIFFNKDEGKVNITSLDGTVKALNLDVNFRKGC